jgi:hypothetical protein
LKENTLKIPRTVWEDISNAAQISWAHLKANWWLKYIVLTIVIVVALAVWAQGARSTEDPNLFAKWIYDFLNDWAITIGAAVTLLLAIAAFLAILDNRRGRRLDRRERLLNEIIDWAENSLAIINKYPTVYFEKLEDLLVSANVLKAKRHDIIIKTNSFNQNLKTLVNNAIKELTDFVERADKHATQMGRKQRISVPNNLETTLVNVIEEAAKIKARDIG